jgi:hypothetical protein
VFFSLPSWAVALLIFLVVGGACVFGFPVGRYLRRHTDVLREPIGVPQGALLGLVGLILALDLTAGIHPGSPMRGRAAESSASTLTARAAPSGITP